MTKPALSALALSMFLAVTTFGSAATAKVGSAAVVPVSSADVSAPTAAEDSERADRWFKSMFDRCQSGAATESTYNYCLAATNLATKVLKDARRADGVYRVRCAKFGASDVGNATCAPVVERASVEAQASR